MDLSANIKKYRKEANLSQKELAETIGTVQAVVSGFELGIKRPNPQNLIDISKALGVTLDVLMGIEKEKLPKDVSRAVWQRVQIIEKLSATEKQKVLDAVDLILNGFIKN